MSTGTTISNQLMFGKIDTTTTLNAINRGILAAWPYIKVNEYATSVATLATGTFIYSLEALTDLNLQYGVARVFVVPDDATKEAEISKRDWTQYRDNSTWWLKFSAAVVTDYSGNGVNVQYQHEPAVIAALTDTIPAEIPDDYLVAYVSREYARKALSQDHTDVRAATTTLQDYAEQIKDSLERAMVPPLSVPYRVGKDRGVG